MNRERLRNSHRNLVEIETEIGEKLESDSEVSVTLDIPETQEVIGMLIEMMFVWQKAELAGLPEVQIAFCDEKTVSFLSTFQMMRPMKTGIAVSGRIVGFKTGTPKLTHNSVDIRIEKRLAAFALSTFGLEDMVKRMLNNLPEMVRQMLNAHLADLGFEVQAKKVKVFFENGEVRAEISR